VSLSVRTPTISAFCSPSWNSTHDSGFQQKTLLGSPGVKVGRSRDLQPLTQVLAVAKKTAAFPRISFPILSTRFSPESGLPTTVVTWLTPMSRDNRVSKGDGARFSIRGASWGDLIGIGRWRTKVVRVQSGGTWLHQ
jgi:hypothetical protein